MLNVLTRVDFELKMTMSEFSQFYFCVSLISSSLRIAVLYCMCKCVGSMSVKVWQQQLS